MVFGEQEVVQLEDVSVFRVASAKLDLGLALGEGFVFGELPRLGPFFLFVACVDPERLVESLHQTDFIFFEGALVSEAGKGEGRLFFSAQRISVCGDPGTEDEFSGGGLFVACGGERPDVVVRGVEPSGRVEFDSV